jgi:hypothetical protein
VNDRTYQHVGIEQYPTQLTGRPAIVVHHHVNLQFLLIRKVISNQLCDIPS